MTEPMVERFETAFPVRPWLRDHHFLGQAVLPMVTAIDFLAALTLEKFPEIDGTRLEKAIFQKLLVISENDSLPVFVELERLDDKRLRAALLTKKSGAVSRLLRHAEVVFGGEANAATELSFPAAAHGTNGIKGPRRAVASEKIYTELVPFGKNFQTLHGKLYLQGDTASGTLIAPDLPFSCRALPNPFLLDGAMHAACVHGQTFCGFVPFPAGFAAMKVKNAHSLQKPGRLYQTHCRLTEKTVNELRYDLRIDGDDGAIELSSLVMRDISGGALQPPLWIRQFP